MSEDWRNVESYSRMLEKIARNKTAFTKAAEIVKEHEAAKERASKSFSNMKSVLDKRRSLLPKDFKVFEQTKQNVENLTKHWDFLELAARSLLLKSIYDDTPNPLIPLSVLKDHSNLNLTPPLWVMAYLDELASSLLTFSEDNTATVKDNGHQRYWRDGIHKAMGFTSHRDHTKFRKLRRDIEINEFIRRYLYQAKQAENKAHNVTKAIDEAARKYHLERGSISKIRYQYKKYFHIYDAPLSILLRQYELERQRLKPIE